MEGKIYKITGGGLTYYGSTIRDLETRFNGHKNDYKKFKQGKKAGCSTSWKVFTDQFLAANSGRSFVSRTWQAMNFPYRKTKPTR